MLISTEFNGLSNESIDVPYIKNAVLELNGRPLVKNE